MDRYLSQSTKPLELGELHITGITCMFIASKFEDVYPLLMKTVFNKIGHTKIPMEQIRQRELEILRVIDFKISSCPHSLDCIGRYIDLIFTKNIKDKEFMEVMSTYLAKMALHHETLSTKSSSLLAAASIYVAYKIQ